MHNQLNRVYGRYGRGTRFHLNPIRISVWVINVDAFVVVAVIIVVVLVDEVTVDYTTQRTQNFGAHFAPTQGV